MADLIVDTYKLRRYAERLNSVNARLTNLDRRLDRLYQQAGLQDLWKLVDANAMTSYKGHLVRCRNYLQDTAQELDAMEKELQKHDPTNFHPFAGKHFDLLDAVTGGIIQPEYPKRPVPGAGPALGIAESILVGFKAFWDGELKDSKQADVLGWTSEDGKSYLGIFAGEVNSSVSRSPFENKSKDLLGDEDHWDINIDQEKKPKYQVGEDESWYDDHAILEGKAEAQIKGSVVSGKVSAEGEYAQGSASADILTAEAHAEVSAGLYVYTKDKDGNVTKVFSPGVSAEVGASVAAVQLQAEGRVGLGEDNNLLGIYGNTEAELLSAEAKGKVAINKNEVYAGASAEANLAKVSATGGVSVLGTDVGVSGSLKVGVGAHAEIGYTDGTFKVDVGAAIGVGFDVGFEVDVSGTVDAVCDVATGIWDSATDAWDETKDKIADAWDWWF